MLTNKQKKQKKLQEAVLITGLLVVVVGIFFVIFFGFRSVLGNLKNNTEKTETSTKESETTTEQTTVTTTAPPEPKGDISDTFPGGHYNNSVPAYFSGAVLVCGDYALELVSGSSAEFYASVVSDFAEKYPNLNVSCAIIPKSSAFYIPQSISDSVGESLKENISSQFIIQKRFIDNTYKLMSEKVNKIDAFGELTKHNGEYTYYRTDHHWNSLGAYYASVAFCNQNGIIPRSIYDYETVRVGEYVGSMQTFCKDYQPILDENPDVTIVRLPRVQTTVTITENGTQREGKLIDTSAPQYWTAFLGGDHPLTKIVTGNSTGRRLLIFKESFGNAFATYMADYFDEIYVVDVREDVEATSSLIQNNGITDVLFINNIFAVSSLVDDIEEKAAS